MDTVQDTKEWGAVIKEGVKTAVWLAEQGAKGLVECFELMRGVDRACQETLTKEKED